MVKSAFLGMGLCLISSFILSLGTYTVSTMPEFHPITKSFWRFLGTFVPAIFVTAYYGWCSKESITESFWPLGRKTLVVFVSIFFRSVFGCTAATLQYYSLKYMDIGNYKDLPTKNFNLSLHVTLIK